MKTGKLNWLIVNLTKGGFDGFYAERAMAEETADGWREIFPGDAFLVVSVVSGSAGEFGIPDDRFMRRFWMDQVRGKKAS